MTRYKQYKTVGTPYVYLLVMFFCFFLVHAILMWVIQRTYDYNGLYQNQLYIFYWPEKCNIWLQLDHHMDKISTTSKTAYFHLFACYFDLSARVCLHVVRYEYQDVDLTSVRNNGLFP